MFKDFKDLLSVFQARRIKYLIVGGYAVSLHAQPRATKDLDILLQQSDENVKAAYGALAEFGAPLDDVSPEDLRDPGKFLRLGQAPVMIDILGAIPGVDFDSAWERRVERLIDENAGLSAIFISREDLVRAKLASGRPQDIADVAALRKAAEGALS